MQREIRGPGDELFFGIVDTVVKNIDDSGLLELLDLDKEKEWIRIRGVLSGLNSFDWPDFSEMDEEESRRVSLYYFFSEEGNYSRIGGTYLFPRKDLISRVLETKFGWNKEESKKFSEKVREKFEILPSNNWGQICDYFSFNPLQIVGFLVDSKMETVKIRIGEKWGEVQKLDPAS